MQIRGETRAVQPPLLFGLANSGDEPILEGDSSIPLFRNDVSSRSITGGRTLNPSLKLKLQDDIAHALRTTGTYVGEIDSPLTQRRVDAQWAAHLAGRDVGVRVKVTVSEELSKRGLPRATLHVISHL